MAVQTRRCLVLGDFFISPLGCALQGLDRGFTPPFSQCHVRFSGIFQAMDRKKLAATC
jgi:hypothetical protein